MGRRNSDDDLKKSAQQISIPKSELTYFWSLWVALGVVLIAGFIVGFLKYQALLVSLNQQNNLISDLRTQIDNLELVRLNEPKRTESQELSNVKSQHNELRERLKAELQKQQKELRTMRRVVDREMAKCTRQEDLTKMRQQITYAERKILSIDISVSGLESRVRSKLMESVDDRLSTFQSNLTETLLAQPLESCTIETKVGQN